MQAREAKHTPGPWQVEPAEQGERYWITAGRDPDICTVWEENDGGRTLANARLIAAAPELLEAAKALVGRWSEVFDSAEARALREAIEKAEGRS